MSFKTGTSRIHSITQLQYPAKMSSARKNHQVQEEVKQCFKEKSIDGCTNIYNCIHMFSDCKSLDGCHINWFFFMSTPENRVSRCVRKGWISGGLQGWGLLLIDILITSSLRFQCDLFLVKHNRLRRPQCQLHRERRTISNGQWGNLHIRTVLRVLLDIIGTNLPEQTQFPSSPKLRTSIRGYLQGSECLRYTKLCSPFQGDWNALFLLRQKSTLS